MIRPFTKTLRLLLTVPACAWAFAGCSAPEHSEIFGAQRAAGENLGTGGATSASGGGTSITGSGGAANPGGKVPTGGRNGGMGKMGGAPAMGSGGAAPIVDPIPGDTGGTDGGVIDATGGASNGTGGQQGGTCVPTAEVCDGLDNNCENGTADEMCPSECKGLAIAGRGYMFCGARELTWLESQKFCVDHGMSLLKLETADENTQVLAVAAGLPNGGIEWAWLGATDIANEGSWVWEGGVHFWQGEANGTPVNGRFSAWMESQPNNSNGGDNCARAFPDTANWTDGDCGVTSAGLICEAD